MRFFFFHQWISAPLKSAVWNLFNNFPEMCRSIQISMHDQILQIQANLLMRTDLINEHCQGSSPFPLTITLCQNSHCLVVTQPDLQNGFYLAALLPQAPSLIRCPKTFVRGTDTCCLPAGAMNLQTLISCMLFPLLELIALLPVCPVPTGLCSSFNVWCTVIFEQNPNSLGRTTELSSVFQQQVVQTSVCPHD